MTGFKRFRAAALSGVLAVSPVVPVLASPALPLTEESAAAALMAQLQLRPAAPATRFDAQQLNAALGEAARLSFAGSETDPDTGATRLTDIRFEIPGAEPVTLFTAREMLVWNLDTAALAARLSGERLGETIRLLDRVELSGVKFDLTDYTNAVDDAITATLPDTAGPVPETVYESAEMTVDRLIFSGLTLHPWTHAEVEGQDEGIAAIRLLSALARSFSFESAALIDSVATQSMSEGGAQGTIVTRYPGQIIQGYHRGDVAATIQTGATFSGTIPVPATGDAAIGLSAATPFEMSGSVDYAAWNGIRFSKLLEYGERGVLPPISERDLWSFGTYTLDGMKFDFGGQPVMEAGRIDISANKFAWFFPERIQIRHEDVSFDMAALLDWAATFEPEGAAGAEGEPSIAEIVGIMERTGLGRLSGDGTLLLSWDSQTGKALIEGNSVSDGLYADDTRFAFTLPAYADLVPAFGVDGLSPDNALLGDIFDAKFAFSGGHYSLTDGGLLDAIAKLTIEIAKISGDSDPMLAGFADSTPESVRMFASGMLMFGSGAVSQDLPQATGWINSLSKFITNGGTFTVKLAPQRPLTAADFTPGADAGMAEAPSAAELVDLFGLSIVHTPAAPTGAGTP